MDLTNKIIDAKKKIHILLEILYTIQKIIFFMSNKNLLLILAHYQKKYVKIIQYNKPDTKLNMPNNEKNQFHLQSQKNFNLL